MHRSLKRISLLGVCLWVCSNILIAANTKSSYYNLSEPDSSYELTIFVIPAFRPINWESPESLLRTTVKSYVESSFNRKLHPLGHIFIELTDQKGVVLIRTSIVSKNPSDQRKLILKDKIGLAMLGASVKGKMESMDGLEKEISRFAKRKSISFIKYKILHPAAERVMEFAHQFALKDSLGKSPSDRYGGADWPRYKGEGSGCSAFGMAALQLTGAKIDYPEWYIKVKVPYDLIGGEYNNMLKIKFNKILKRKSWYEGSGEENVDYYTHFIYDPHKIYTWILDQLSTSDLPEGFSACTITASNGRKIKGLSFDATYIKTYEETIFKKRESPSLFIN